jgi:hypothetical protein
MSDLYSITINQAAIAVLFRVTPRHAGKPMPGVFPRYPALGGETPPAGQRRRQHNAALPAKYPEASRIG